MSKQDMRLPELQLGLGVWINGKARFYSMQTLKAHNNAVIDTFDQENLVVFIDPLRRCPWHTAVMRVLANGMETSMICNRKKMRDGRRF
jgi:hypothetical protein